MTTPVSEIVIIIHREVEIVIIIHREVGFDLTMNYYDDFGYRSCLLAGQITDSSVGLVSHDAGRLTLTTRSVTRTPSAGSVSWQVPDEIVRTLIVQPFVRVGSDLLLAQRNADGTCIPVLLRISGGWGPGEAVAADAMVPFWTAVPSAADPDKMVQAGGYAVSKEGRTQLRLFDPVSGSLGGPLCEVEGTVLSVSEFVRDGRPKLCMLCEETDVRRIWVYDLLSDSGYRLPGEFGCSRIVAAK